MLTCCYDNVQHRTLLQYGICPLDVNMNALDSLSSPSVFLLGQDNPLLRASSLIILLALVRGGATRCSEKLGTLSSTSSILDNLEILYSKKCDAVCTSTRKRLRDLPTRTDGRLLGCVGHVINADKVGDMKRTQPHDAGRFWCHEE